MESIISAISRHSSHLVVIEVSLVILIIVLFVATWLYNRKKYQNLKHQIPATVVKSYLDSIIQNSTALKSSLFRGGGLDQEGAVPSVLPLSELPQGVNVSSDADSAALQAEISNLRAQLADKTQALREVEDELNSVNGELKEAKRRIAELEALLKQQGSADGDNSAILQELDKVKDERDQLLERLKEFEIIEDDLANLKRLEQENSQLRKALEQAGIDIPKVEKEQEQEEVAPTSSAPEEEVVELEPEPESEQDSADEVVVTEQTEDEGDDGESESEEVAVTEAEEEQTPEEEEQSMVADDSDDSDKSPEDLLSEFEKMLG